MHYTVFAAYHLVLETSFFEDQRAFLNNRSISKEENSVGMKEGPSPVFSNGYLPASPTDNDASALKLYPVASNGSLVEYADGETATVSSTNPDALNSPAEGFPNELPEGTVIHYDSSQTLRSENLQSSVSGSLRRFIDIFRHRNIYLPVTSSQETANHQKEGRNEISQEIASNDFHVRAKEEEPVDSGENMDHLNDIQKPVSTRTNQQMALADPSVCEKHEQSSVPLENGKQHSTSYISEEKTSDIEEADDSLDSQSILILMSSQCISKQVICEQSHLSRIKYYGNFDVSLGRYLQDILQNQVTLLYHSSSYFINNLVPTSTSLHYGHTEACPT